MLLAVGGCKFGETAIGPGREQIVVHAALDPNAYDHFVLLEKLLTGREDVRSRVPFDSLDPIVTGGGVPVSGAAVIVYGPDGDSAVATELSQLGGTGKGAGVYRFFNAAPDPLGGPDDPLVRIVPGGSYRLRITTTDGRVLNGSTVVPSVVGGTGSGLPDRFNRDHESVFLYWQDVPGAARYLIRVSSPRGPFSIFVDSLEFLVSGALQNTSFNVLADVFVPGFTQDVSVLAVDANYFDYYRSGNDDFTGRGLLNHVDGGLGVFGSFVALRQIRLRVTADFDEPIEGSYERVAGAGPFRIDLFVTSRAGARVELSGNYENGSPQRPGVLGRILSDSLTLSLLRGQSAADTTSVIDGRLEGELLRGRFRGSGGGAVEYRKLPP